MILPLRNPVVFAKECATLDMLTGGRFILGVGVGWLHEEFDAIGVGWDDRGAHTDDSIHALRALWNNEVANYQGTHSSFSDIYSFPKPANGTIPVVVGGHSKPAARRAGRFGDGFFPADPRKLPELLPVMRAAAEEAGRDPNTKSSRCSPTLASHECWFHRWQCTQRNCPKPWANSPTM
jgi:alkanesulfonate monooxygenase SsuD/methylene tetrahydromethanopterin reductase-like flavin-dependent oxidoreductase (luciferase family)